MFKLKGNDITLEGDGYDLIIEITGVLIHIIESLVEEGCLSSIDIPDLLDAINNELYKQTKDLRERGDK